MSRRISTTFDVKLAKSLLLASAAGALAACGGGVSADDSKGGGDPALQKKLADPAPAGELELSIETLATGLENPWDVTFLPNGDILVTERPGRVRVIRDGALLPNPVDGVPAVLSYNQGGLFDILLHPDFEDNQTIYLSYANGTESANATRLSRAKFDGARIYDVETLYDAAPEKDTGHHFGGRLVWGPDNKIYMTIGEGSRYKEKAQDMTSSFGSVIRLNEDGSIPDDNPPFGDDVRPELWTKGHRNPQGMTYDAERSILWENEHGPRGGDEINIIKPGNNYGWPLASYGTDYSGSRITPFTEYEGTAQPYKYWTPSIAVSGMAVYRGDLFPAAWDGDLLVGALAGAALHRVDLGGADGLEELGEERFELLNERIRDVRVGPDGAIYVATDLDGDGKVLRVTPK